MRPERGTDDAGEVAQRLGGHAVSRRYQRNLANRRQVEVHRAEQMGERLGMADRGPMQQAQRPDPMALVLAVPSERRKPEQTERRGGVARWDRMVVDVLAPRDQLLVVARGGEETPAL